MKILLKNARVVNVFTEEILNQDVLIQDERIVGVGDYADESADVVRDLSQRYVCPGFIDGHIHVESTQVLPDQLAVACLEHGTTSIVTDPHEIANVCGPDGIEFMLQASQGLPVTNYIMLPSCVPSSPFDEAGATITANDLQPFYGRERVLGLAEVMNYPGAVAGDVDLQQKIADCKVAGLVVNGHAPLLSGKDLDTYIALGIRDDHECTSFEEAQTRIRSGQTLMVREGTTARNLEALIDCFDQPYSNNCMLVSDDRNALTLVKHGSVDHIIRKAVTFGKSVLTGIRLTTINPARHFGLENLGAVAPGYIADLVIFDSLETLQPIDVYKGGKLVVQDGQVLPFDKPQIATALYNRARNSFHIQPVTPDVFAIDRAGRCNVIGAVSNQLITQALVMEVAGADAARDIAKVAVLERHHGTGQVGLGYVCGMGLACGAIASSVSHDSHNLIVAGMDDESMALAANHLIEIGGGLCVVKGGRVVASLPLPIAGLMSDASVKSVAEKDEELTRAVEQLGVPHEATPFMTLAFISLPVIPFLKITARGLVDVAEQKRLPLFLD